ncbi:MAG: hypothetical protein GX579_20165 [Chloroflexi bacterium]|nr:hypothetical protein [Chloroflexota bacterium]
MENETIDIVIMDEDEPVVHVAERKPAALRNTVAETGRGVAEAAQTAWERLPREELQTAARAGARVSRRGAARGLRWLSKRLEAWAARLRDSA